MFVIHTKTFKSTQSEKDELTDDELTVDDELTDDDPTYVPIEGTRKRRRVTLHSKVRRKKSVSKTIWPRSDSDC